MPVPKPESKVSDPGQWLVKVMDKVAKVMLYKYWDRASFLSTDELTSLPDHKYVTMHAIFDLSASMDSVSTIFFVLQKKTFIYLFVVLF